MSYKMKKVMSLLIAFFVMFSMVAVETGEASAASAKVKVYINNQIDKDNNIYVGEQAYVGAYPTKGTKLATVKKVKIADKTIAKVKVKKFKYGGKTYREFYAVGKKPGKTKVSVKYKYKGKTKTKKVTLTVREYPNPIASLTVNGKQIPLKGKTSFIYEAKCKKTKVKIKAVPADGWEITYADGFYTYGSKKHPKYKNLKKVKGKIKNGKTIKFAKKNKQLYTSFFLQDEKGTIIMYEVILKR